MNPQTLLLLFKPKSRPDYRKRRGDDEMPLHFLVSNLTYRLVIAIDQRFFQGRN